MITIDMKVNGVIYGHDVSLNLSTDGTYHAHTTVHPAFREHFDAERRTGRAGGHATDLDLCLQGLRGDLEKTYVFAGLKVGR